MGILNNMSKDFRIDVKQEPSTEEDILLLKKF
jgi:hypothetical protein